MDNKDREIKSHAKFIRLSPRKARLVVDAVRGLSALEAVEKLRLMPQKAANEVSKVIKSAMANAEHNFGISKNDLIIKEIKADSGPTFKRYKPRARGSADVMRKKTTHISIILISTTGKKVEKKVEKKKEEPKKEVKKETLKKKEEITEKEEKEEVKEVKKQTVQKKAFDKKTEKQKPEIKKPVLKKDIKTETKKAGKKDTFLGGIRDFFRRKGM